MPLTSFCGTLGFARPCAQARGGEAMRRYVLPILVAFWMVGGSVARADDGISEREKALAKKSYQHALELYKVGDYKAAAAELRKAYDYAPLPPILFNLGVTYMKLGNKSAAKAAL